MTDKTTPSRRRGRPCKEPPWLKEVAEMVGRGIPLRRALWSKEVRFTENELKGIYRLKRFRQYYEEAKFAYIRAYHDLPPRRHTSIGERYLQARLEAERLEDYIRSI